MLFQRPIYSLFSFRSFCSKTPSLKTITKIKKMIPETKAPNRAVPQVKIDKEAKGLLEHFGEKKFAPIDKQTFYCKDSRGDDSNFGAPGGDFGEFLLALDCYSFISKAQKEVEVDMIFGRWLDERCSKERPFYLHTDRPALTRLFQSLGKEELKEPSDLDKELQGRFINEFGSSSNFQGCGHLRLILEDIEGKSYEIKRKLFESLSAAFFKRYFEGDERLKFKIYETVQDGRALAVIYGSAELKEESILATQTVGEDQIFILNQHAVSNYRKQFLVPFFCSISNKEDLSVEEMYRKMEEKGWRNAMLSANTLAGGKPIYRVDLTK